MKSQRKLLIAIGLIIICSNLPFITPIFTLFLDEKHYKYSNYDGTCANVEFMSRNFEMMKRLHQHCLIENPNQKDKKMYRLFAKNPFAFWRWRLYLVSEKYKLPYRDFEELQKLRGKDWKYDTGGVPFAVQ